MMILLGHKCVDNKGSSVQINGISIHWNVILRKFLLTDSTGIWQKFHQNSDFSSNRISIQCIGKIFCVTFQGHFLKIQTKYSTYILKNFHIQILWALKWYFVKHLQVTLTSMSVNPTVLVYMVSGVHYLCKTPETATWHHVKLSSPGGHHPPP